MDEQPLLQVERRGAVAIWRIDRQNRRNSLSRETLLEIGKLARAVARDASVRAVIVTGAGDQAFCAGADLKERQGMDDHQVLAQVELYRTELGPLDRCPKPVVAAINGAALGGGVELALSCDLRVAAPHAWFAFPETSLGIIPGAGGTQRLPRIVGEGRAKELILLGRRLQADEALAWGLISRIAPHGRSVVDDAMDWIAPIVDGAADAQAAALRAIDASFDLSLDEGLRCEKEIYTSLLSSTERERALQAFSSGKRLFSEDKR